MAGLAALAPLFAIASERWGGLNPCPLCLWQRWPYWAAVALALAAALLAGRPRAALLGLGGVAVLASAGIAALHAGVEFGWWPSPLPACAVPTATLGLSVDDILASLAPRPAKPCDEPTFLIPGLPLSMAAMNLLYALALGAFALNSARKERHA
jgi:disulfide bond formation protein DsbB